MCRNEVRASAVKMLTYANETKVDARYTLFGDILARSCHKLSAAILRVYHPSYVVFLNIMFLLVVYFIGSKQWLVQLC